MIDCCSCSGIFAPAKQTITTSTSSSSSQMSENHSDRSSNTSHLTDRLALTSLITPVQNLHIPRLAALVETQTAVPWGLSWKHKVVWAPAITRAAAAAAAQNRSEREVVEEEAAAAAASSATSLAPAWLCCEATKVTFSHSPIQGRRCTAAQIVVKCEPGDGHSLLLGSWISRFRGNLVLRRSSGVVKGVWKPWWWSVTKCSLLIRTIRSACGNDPRRRRLEHIQELLTSLSPLCLPSKTTWSPASLPKPIFRSVCLSVCLCLCHLLPPSLLPHFLGSYPGYEQVYLLEIKLKLPSLQKQRRLNPCPSHSARSLQVWLSTVKEIGSLHVVSKRVELWLLLYVRLNSPSLNLLKLQLEILQAQVQAEIWKSLPKSYVQVDYVFVVSLPTFLWTISRILTLMHIATILLAHKH